MEDTVLQDEEVPEEIEEQCVNCHHSLAAIERIIKPLFSSNMADMEDEAKVSTAISYTRAGIRALKLYKFKVCIV